MRLEQSAVCADSLLEGYFNSIKVRLERYLGVSALTSCTFQFHKGAIRTVIRSLCTLRYRNYFNSINDHSAQTVPLVSLK